MLPFLHQHPFVRLVVPWMAGIVAADRCFDPSVEPQWLLLLLFLLLLCTLACAFIMRYARRWLFGLSLFFLCFTAAWWITTLRLYPVHQVSFPLHEVVYRVQLMELPEVKPRSLHCRVRLLEWRDSVQQHPMHGQVLLFMQRDSLSERLTGGEELWMATRLTPPAPPQNFDAFDYGRYLQRRGICGTGWVAAGRWCIRSVQAETALASFSWLERLQLQASRCREMLQNQYRSLGIDGEEGAVLAALTLGDKSELSETIRESYSVAGASHVLALSGLHLGLLYGLFFFLFRPLARCGQAGRWLRTVCLVGLLWLFALLTGLSPSVVRSACFFSILALSQQIGRQSLSLNTLAFTAWLMLLVQPLWLFDVGFQLSFAAVASILGFQPLLYDRWNIRSRIGRSLWGLLSVSLAAQLGTAPLVLLYFSRLATHFLLTNLLVIPGVTLLLYAAVVLWLFTPFSSLQALWANGIAYLLTLLNRTVRWLAHLPGASADGGWFYPLEVAALYVLLLYLLYGLRRPGTRSYPFLRNFLFLLLVWTVLHQGWRWADRPSDCLVFYQVRSCPAVHCIESNGRSFLHYVDSLPRKQDLQRVASAFWRHHRLLPPVETTASFQSAECVRHHSWIDWHGVRILCVHNNQWRGKLPADSLYRLDYLYICKGYTGSLNELQQLFRPQCVILDSSLSVYRRNRLKAECKQSRLHFISLSEEGSVRFLH